MKKLLLLAVLILFVASVGEAQLYRSPLSIIPSQGGNSGKFLTTNGASLSWGTAGGGSVSNAAVISALDSALTNVLTSDTWQFTNFNLSFGGGDIVRKKAPWFDFEAGEPSLVLDAGDTATALVHSTPVLYLTWNNETDGANIYLDGADYGDTELVFQNENPSTDRIKESHIGFSSYSFDNTVTAPNIYRTVSSGYTDNATTTTGEDLLLTMGGVDSTVLQYGGERYIGEITGVFSNNVSTNRLRLYNVDDGTIGQQLVFDTGDLSNTAASTWVIRFTSITAHLSGGGYTIRVSASIQVDGLTVSSPVQYTEVVGGGSGDTSSFFQLTGQASGGAGKITETMYSFEYHK